MAVGAVITFLRLSRGEEFFGGQATTIILLLLLSSFQLFFLFIIGQYVARTYNESRDRPLYVVASTAGLCGAQVPNQRVQTVAPDVDGKMNPTAGNRAEETRHGGV